MNTVSAQSWVRPMIDRSGWSRLVIVLLACGTVYWLANCIRILTVGLSTLGIDTYGATWGILVVNTVHMIGISHVGIAVSAAVRVLRLDEYRSIARTAELITLISLLTALTNLTLHVGRPIRFLVNVFAYGKWHSPMVWSMTVFVLYFLASSVYLYLSLRRDLWAMGESAPRWKWLYRLLAFGYQDSQEERRAHRSALFWLAICLVPIMVSVHSVYGLLFGMLSAKVGWYNPLQAPYFVLGAIVSGFSAILVVAALLRRAYAWHEALTDRLFKVFGAFLAFVVFLYLYFMLSEHLTAQYLPTVSDRAVSDALLTGPFSVPFWLATLIGLLIPFAYLLAQSIGATPLNVGLTAAAAMLVNVAVWLKRYLTVIPAQFHPQLRLPRPEVAYVPTLTEWTAVLGSYVAAALVFVALLKVLPLFELPAAADAGHESAGVDAATKRTPIVLLILLVGMMMIVWGVATRDFDFAPVKWIFGLTVIVSVPLHHCLLATRRQRSRKTVAADSDDELTGRE